MPNPMSSSRAAAPPARLAPAPSHSIGRLARATRSANSSIAASDGASGEASGSEKQSSSAGRGIAVRCTSIGTSTLTGPIGGVSASTAARVSTPKVWSAERMR